MEMIRREWPGIKPPSSAIGGRWKYIVVSMHPASDHAGIERTRSQIREGEWQFHSTEFRGGEDCWLLVVCSPEDDLEITLLAECLDPVDSWLSARILDLYVRQSMPPLMLWRKGQGCGTVEPFDKLS